MPLDGANPLNTSGLVPVEFFVVIALDPQEDKTPGGIILLDQSKDADKLKAEEGVLVAASPLAFNYDNWPEGSRKPQEGDRVLFKRFNGFIRERNGRNYRLCPDKDVIAIVENMNE